MKDDSKKFVMESEYNDGGTYHAVPVVAFQSDPWCIEMQIGAESEDGDPFAIVSLYLASDGRLTAAFGRKKAVRVQDPIDFEIPFHPDVEILPLPPANESEGG